MLSSRQVIMNYVFIAAHELSSCQGEWNIYRNATEDVVSGCTACAVFLRSHLVEVRGGFVDPLVC